MTWASRFHAMAASRVFEIFEYNGVAICGTVYVPIPAYRDMSTGVTSVKRSTCLVVDHLMFAIVLLQ